MPDRYQLLRIDLPDDVAGVDATSVPVIDIAAARAAGDAWLAGETSTFLRVKSIVAPHSYNFLLNPSHPDITRLQILSAEHWPFDPRLIA